MIRIFILTVIVFLSLNAGAHAYTMQGNLPDYEGIYENLEEADFEYIFGLDPGQPDEYTKYMYSPYPLFRSGVDIEFKSKVIPPGYYLLTPREKNDKTWILFKENGRVSYTIPVYKEEDIPKDFYEKKLPHVNLNAYQKAAKKSKGFFGKHFGKKSQRTPIPPAYIEFDDRGDYWDMILYYGYKKYYMLFKKI